MRISDWSSDVCSSDLEGAHRHGEGGGEVQSFAHLVDAEKHDAQKAGLQKEGGQYFVCHKRSDYRAGPIGKDRPVRAELIGHDNARDDTHAKDRSEEHKSELQSLMRISYAVFRLKKK